MAVRWSSGKTPSNIAAFPVLTIRRFQEGPVSASTLAAVSAAALKAEGNATLVVAEPGNERTVLGAFQRGRGPKRGSGGSSILVGPGRVWLSLALSQCSALVPDATPSKLLNRYVRPLLRALTKVTNVPANYFGRDWISVAQRPVAFVGFAHDATTGRALFEAIVAVRAPVLFASSPSLLGRVPGTLVDIAGAGREIRESDVIRAVENAYTALASETAVVVVDATAEDEDEDEDDDTPWLSTLDVAMGKLGCGPDRTGRLRIGGEIMASADAIAQIEAALLRDPNADLESIIDEAFTTRDAALFGVPSLASIRDVILAARTSLGARSRS